MKKILLLFVIVSFFVSMCNTDKWDEGGSLHDATLSDWKKASESNKLATCSDFVVVYGKPPVEYVDGLPVDEWRKKRAIALRCCVDDAMESGYFKDHEKVEGIIDLCKISVGSSCL